MAAPPLVGTNAPSPVGNPGYATPLALNVPIFTAEPAVFYGAPGGPVPQAHVPMHTVVRGRLQHEPMQYDRYPLNYTAVHPTQMPMHGLGLVRTIPGKATPEKVSLPIPSPVKQSTIYAVVAGSALVVAASVALFVLLRKKG